MKNLLDENGYLEAVIRSRLYRDSDREWADKIIARLRGDDERDEQWTKESDEAK